MSAWRAKALEYFPALRAEIEAAPTAGDAWVEVISRLKSQYDRESVDWEDSCKLLRGVCMYATWCKNSSSYRVREVALIEFYYYFPGFAMSCPEPVYRRIVAELVANIGIAEVEKMGAGLRAADLEKFLNDARWADAQKARQRLSR